MTVVDWLMFKPWRLCNYVQFLCLVTLSFGFLYIVYKRIKKESRKLTCSVATEPKQVEESKMVMPTETFLKDYKIPDYYFETVCL